MWKGQVARTRPTGLRGDGAARNGARCDHLQCFDQRLGEGLAVMVSPIVLLIDGAAQHGA